MTVSSTSTWDATTPTRPALSDITGGTKTNRPGYAPNPVTQPTAEEDNQRAKQIAATGGIIPLALVYVTFPAGVPTIAAVKAPGTLVTVANFTPIDNGPGDTTIHWAATGVLPPIWSAPDKSQADDVEIDRIRAFYTTSGIPGGRQGLRVKTKLGATGTDAAVLLTIY